VRVRGLNPVVVLVLLVLVGGLVGALVAVAQPRQPARTPFVPPTGEAGSLPPPATGTPGPPASTSAASPPSPSSSGSAAGSGSVPIDSSLLAILPTAIDGLPLTEDPATEAHDAADPTHAADLDGLAVAILVDPATSNLAVASVVRLRPGVFSGDYFRSWRDSFNTGACSQAGGVAGAAESTIGGHPAFIGHCNGGLLTHHVYLPDRDVIVSISSIGEKRLGERIVEGLR
jgi:hypothetical protein